MSKSIKQHNKRVVLITGGGSGIGAAISTAFLNLGDQVVIAQRRPIDNVELSSADFQAIDLADLQAIPSLIERVMQDYGRLDVLINNAGVMTQAPTQHTTLDDWQHSITVNLSAPFVLIKHALPHLIASTGAIVNIGSVEGIAANPQHSAYCASKAGLHGLTRAVAVDYGAQGVRCNAIAPGWIDTQFNEAYINSQPNPADFRAKLQDIHPLAKIGQPADVAALAVWLADPQAAFITGQVWQVDGGRMSQLSAP